MVSIELWAWVENINISDIVRAAERIKLASYAANDRVCEPDAVNSAEHLSRPFLAVTYGYRPHFYIIKHAANPARRSGKIAADIIIFASISGGVMLRSEKPRYQLSPAVSAMRIVSSRLSFGFPF